MRLSISIAGLDGLARGLREAPGYTDQVLQAAMLEATLLAQREWQENMPRGATGLTAGSIHSDVSSTPAGVLGVVGSSQPSAVWVELGTRPHMPPSEALQPWVKAVLGIHDPKEVRNVAFLVARKIARHGTPAQRPMARAVEATEGQIIAIFERAAAQVAAHIAEGSA
ncbi:hypothetical protein J1777_05940 [Comamonas denitrificans]|uniref:Uncharacterized protein n=1 Tax=Comamonas denitrificans TaxID=117506 RepID=A0A939KDH8_9BURK|nr:hypothetical protein [Comamonas denitrificans]MBO1249379.1 hypothetical protein [Comamonas denitrificans]